jgi:ATP-dependent Lon protease
MTKDESKDDPKRKQGSTKLRKKRKRARLLPITRKKSDQTSETSETESDVDEHGNIKNLISYSDDEMVVQIPTTTRSHCSHRGRSDLTSNVRVQPAPLPSRGEHRRHARVRSRQNLDLLENLSQRLPLSKKPRRSKRLRNRDNPRSAVRDGNLRSAVRDGNTKESAFITYDFIPDFMPGAEYEDEQLTKMLVLQQLVNSVEKMDNRQRKKKKKRKRKIEEETSDESETSSDDESDLESTFTPDEETWFEEIKKREKKFYTKQFNSIKRMSRNEVPLKFQILKNTKLNNHSRAFLLNRLESWQNMEQHDNEYHKLTSWFNHFQKIPFGEFVTLPLTHRDPPKKIFKYLSNARQILDNAVFGHDHVKDEIVQMIAGWISNPQPPGQVLALQGPPGNGKTTIVKEGLSKALDRPFVLIALGGAKDSAFLQGHEYTFEGSKPGKMVEVIRNCGCMNPVIFFDEVDKISETPTGKEISNLLCHILDPVQNSTFEDRYFSGVHLDLSKCVFVLSFNDPSKIDPILKDRMRVINMKGFKTSEKVTIGQTYLLPKIKNQYCFKPKQIRFDDSTLEFIIQKYTKECGVRELRRCLDCIVSKLNVLKLVGRRTEKNIKKIVKFKTGADQSGIRFPLLVSPDMASELLKSSTNTPTIVPNMYL